MSWRRAVGALMVVARRLGTPGPTDSAACSLTWPTAASSSLVAMQQQHLRSPSWSQAQGFASSAAAGRAAAQAAAAAAPDPASTTAPAAEVAAAAAAVAAGDLPPVYSRLPGRIEGPYTVPQKAVFAVVELGGTQYKVTPDDLVITEKLAGVDVNDRVRLDRVLLLGSRAEMVIGRPFVPGAHVVAAVEEQFLDGKVLIFHKRRRKNSRRLRGHRQPLTSLRILEVHGIEDEAAQPAAASA